MTFVDRERELREELGLKAPSRVPLFYDDNREPVFREGCFTVEAGEDEPPGEVML